MLPRKNYYLNDYFDIFSMPFNKEYMKTDIYEKDNKYILEIDLPGVKKDNIKINYENGYLTILELKSRKAGISAVKQLLRYVNDFKEDKERVRGILVAPGVTDDAQEMLDYYELEFKMVEPPKELKIDKKVTLDFFV